MAHTTWRYPRDLTWQHSIHRLYKNHLLVVPLALNDNLRWGNCRHSSKYQRHVIVIFVAFVNCQGFFNTIQGERQDYNYHIARFTCKVQISSSKERREVYNVIYHVRCVSTIKHLGHLQVFKINNFCFKKESTGTHPKGSWWRHQMEIFSALLVICAGNSPVTGEFDLWFDLWPASE